MPARPNKKKWELLYVRDKYLPSFSNNLSVLLAEEKELKYKLDRLQFHIKAQRNNRNQHRILRYRIKLRRTLK
jgi:hypothetical protein